MPGRVPRHLLAARPWRSRTGRLLHRALDAAGWQALDRDRDGGRAPAAGEVSEMTSPRVLLTTLSVRVSAKGRQYLSGWLGKASVVAWHRQVKELNVYIIQPSVKNLPDDLRLWQTSSEGEFNVRFVNLTMPARRLVALARFQAARITRLERQLAEACRPRPRRRRVPDARQLALSF
jgi:hypothetical protein